MTNAIKLLAALDERLTCQVELTLYGRAALQLGFPNPPPEYALSRDVDAVMLTGVPVTSCTPEQRTGRNVASATANRRGISSAGQLRLHLDHGEALCQHALLSACFA